MTGRRRVLQSIAAVVGLALASRWRVGNAAARRDGGPMDEALAMRRLATAAGDQPYGAVVVKDGEIVGEGPSRVIVNGDPTAHAEMEAIRDAARRLGTRNLEGCVLYATSRPCRMCETAAYWANVAQVYYGAGHTDGGRPRYDSC